MLACLLPCLVIVYGEVDKRITNLITPDTVHVIAAVSRLPACANVTAPTNCRTTPLQRNRSGLSRYRGCLRPLGVRGPACGGRAACGCGSSVPGLRSPDTSEAGPSNFGKALAMSCSSLPVHVTMDSALRIKVTDLCGHKCTFCHNEGTPVAGDNRGLSAGQFTAAGRSGRVSIYLETNGANFLPRRCHLKDSLKRSTSYAVPWTSARSI